MLNWFEQQDSAVQAAIIAGIVSIVCAVVTGIFKLLAVWRSNRKNISKDSEINITQSTTGSNNTIIGIQNNKEN